MKENEVPFCQELAKLTKREASIEKIIDHIDNCPQCQKFPEWIRRISKKHWEKILRRGP
jgi:ribosomal protein L37AE/L43A